MCTNVGDPWHLTVNVVQGDVAGGCYLSSKEWMQAGVTDSCTLLISDCVPILNAASAYSLVTVFTGVTA